MTHECQQEFDSTYTTRYLTIVYGDGDISDDRALISGFCNDCAEEFDRFQVAELTASSDGEPAELFGFLDDRILGYLTIEDYTKLGSRLGDLPAEKRNAFLTAFNVAAARREVFNP